MGQKICPAEWSFINGLGAEAYIKTSNLFRVHVRIKIGLKRVYAKLRQTPLVKNFSFFFSLKWFAGLTEFTQ